MDAAAAVETCDSVRVETESAAVVVNVAVAAVAAAVVALAFVDAVAAVGVDSCRRVATDARCWRMHAQPTTTRTFYVPAGHVAAAVDRN